MSRGNWAISRSSRLYIGGHAEARRPRVSQLLAGAGHRLGLFLSAAARFEPTVAEDARGTLGHQLLGTLDVCRQLPAAFPLPRAHAARSTLDFSGDACVRVLVAGRCRLGPRS